MKRLLRRAITALEADPPRSPCHHLWRGVSIRQNGDVEPCSCANVSDVNAGNVAEQGVLPILDSPAYRASRAFLREFEVRGNPPPIDDSVFGPCRACPVVNHRVLPLEDFRPAFDKLFRDPAAKARPLRKRVKKYWNFVASNLNHRWLREKVRTYPLKATIDVANVCNLRCPICQVGSETLPHPRGIMSLEMFRQILEEIGDYLFEIEFYRYGEPLANKKLPEMVRLAKSYGIRTKISTNLLLLNEKMARELLDAGLDIVVACADGASQEVYIQYRRRGDFDKFMKLMRRWLELKAELGRGPEDAPKIQWQYLVFRHNEHELEEARALADELGIQFIEAPAYYSGTADPDEWAPSFRRIENRQSEIQVLTEPGGSTTEAGLSIPMSHEFPLTLRVTNLVEGRSWEAGDKTLLAGARIYDAEKKFLAEFGRARLPSDVQPGNSVELQMQLQAPRQLGRYWLKLDMLREYGTWFEAEGSQPAWIPLEVVSAPLVQVLDISQEIGAEASFEARIRIHCHDNFTWPHDGEHAVRAGVKLYQGDGRFIMDFGRADLPGPLEPGQSLELTMPLVAPEKPGTYRLEFDMVKEFEYWFEERGSVPVRLDLMVREPATVQG